MVDLPKKSVNAGVPDGIRAGRRNLSVVTLDNLGDFTLANYAAVSRAGAAILLTPNARKLIDERRAAFLRHVNAEPAPWVYGVTGGMVHGRPVLWDASERQAQANRPVAAGAVLFGDELPVRIVRGAIMCRLTNFIEGHAAVRSRLACAVADMLGQDLPPVPRPGHASAGETWLLSHLFASLTQSTALEAKEPWALLNGAPVASALLADSVLRAGVLLAEVMDAVALAVGVFGAPAESYDPALGVLWNSQFAAAASAPLYAAARLSGAPRVPQAPVSFRAAPRLLARALRTYLSLRRCAESALRAVTDNPVVVDDGDAWRTLSNGGFFDADAPALFDEWAGVSADLARLLEKLGARLAETSASADVVMQARLRALVASLAGFAEDGSAVATRTPLPGTDGGGAPQNDLLSPVMQAWSKQLAAGDLLCCAAASLRGIAACLGGDATFDVRARDAAIRTRMNAALDLPPEFDQLGG